jgi:hypothetical protein
VTGAFGNLIVPLSFVLVLVLLRVASGSRRRGRRTLEPAAATSPVSPKPASPKPPAVPKPAPARRSPAPARSAPAPVVPQRPVAPGSPLLERGTGPRWAANAIVAAEVFGPPVAARPGGTLGPPNAL